MPTAQLRAVLWSWMITVVRLSAQAVSWPQAASGDFNRRFSVSRRARQQRAFVTLSPCQFVTLSKKRVQGAAPATHIRYDTQTRELQADRGASHACALHIEPGRSQSGLPRADP